MLAFGENVPALRVYATIDEIMTALAAGQSLIARNPQLVADDTQRRDVVPAPSRPPRARDRFREPVRNDPQAMASTGVGPAQWGPRG
jgi:hypothetical protein